MNSLEILAIWVMIIGTPLILILLTQAFKNFRKSGLL